MASQKKAKNKAAASEPAGFGAYLRRLRDKRGVPLRVVAAAVGMDQAHLSKAELGQRLPTADQADALARFFGEDPIELKARRIAEKFRQEHLGNPAAARAVLILHGQAGESAKVEVRQPAPEEPGPVADRSVIVMHAD